MERTRALIVDDEPLARKRLTDLLASYEDVEIIGEAEHGAAAIEKIERDRPDLVFLDIQMPDLDGFDVLQAIDPAIRPVTIFVTAFDQFALKAFDVHAVDYLVKPVDRRRFTAAVDRALSPIHQAQTDQLRQKVDELLALRQRENRALRQIVVKKAGRIVIVRTDSVDWIEAAGNYAALHVGKEEHLIRETMNTLEDKLPAQFVRIHRSVIVNSDRISEMFPSSHGDYFVMLADQTRLTMSRLYRDRVESVIGRL
jgi:two-component system, LytTR family, response regulator